MTSLQVSFVDRVLELMATGILKNDALKQAAPEVGYTAQGREVYRTSLAVQTAIDGSADKMQVRFEDGLKIANVELAQRLFGHATADLGDVMDLSTMRLKPMSEWPPGFSEHVKKIKLDGEGVVTDIEMYDKLRATEQFLAISDFGRKAKGVDEQTQVMNFFSQFVFGDTNEPIRRDADGDCEREIDRVREQGVEDAESLLGAAEGRPADTLQAQLQAGPFREPPPPATVHSEEPAARDIDVHSD